MMVIILEKKVYFSSPITKINFEIISFDTDTKQYTLKNAVNGEIITFDGPLPTSRISFSAFDPYLDDEREEDADCILYLLRNDIRNFPYISEKYNNMIKETKKRYRNFIKTPLYSVLC